MLRLAVHSLLPCDFWAETHKHMKNNVKKWGFMQLGHDKAQYIIHE